MSKPKSPSFDALIGETIWVMMHNHVDEAILRGVEAGGLWIESEELCTLVLRLANQRVAPVSFVFFLPFHSMLGAMRAVGGVSFDVKGLGLGGP